MPGIGKAMVNVGNGNVLVQVDDLDVPERGIDLAFRRTYNSQSRHDASNSDGSIPSVFGNGWTNTFDAHLAYNATYNIISVYDIDGARYDYTSDGQGHWIAPAGQYAQLTSDGSCGYYWTKKTGAAYYFEAPNSPPGCTIPTGLAGRILAIQGRNVNNSLTFTYSWANGDDTNPENLTQIVVAHSDGQSLTLSFGLLSGTGPDELTSITRPDGSTIAYEYDNAGDLLEVDRPGNNTTSAQNCVPNPNPNPLCIPETYTYSGTYLLASANSPRYTVSQRNNGGTAQEGDTVNFAFDGSRRATSMTDDGVVNFTPQDGVSPGLGSQGVLQQSYPTGLQSWYTESLSGYDSGVTTVSDSDGHSRMWTFDSLWRVTMTQAWTGSQWLVSYEQWNGSDNLIAFTDERDYESTLAYDGSGNAIMEAQPSVTTSMGTFQPTAWYQYDQYNNLLYYCDPNYSHQHGGDYPGGSNPCTGSPSGVVHYLWATGSAPEIYGQLSDTYTPLGYHHRLSYDSNGMPLSVAGDTITQADNTQRTPTQSFTYDAYGNLQTYNPGNGTWHLTYDNLNRVLTREDPDSVYSYICYYADGSAHYTETSYQHSRDNGVPGTYSCSASPPGIYATAFTYDADGDVLTQTAVHGGAYVANALPTLPTTQGVTQKFYDGADRLIEVENPYDSANDVYQNPWLTRYLYDLSQNGTVSFDNGAANYGAHGSLYKTVELLPSAPGLMTLNYPSPPPSPSPAPSPTPVPNSIFQDLKGTAFDALGRPTTGYTLVYDTTSQSDALRTDTGTYDTNASSLGFLAQFCNAAGQCRYFSYDARGATDAASFSDSTGNRTATFDPDDRVVSLSSTVLNGITQSYTYDADGRLTNSTDWAGAQLTRHFYADGKEESLDVSGPSLVQAGLFTYSYRGDARLQTFTVDDSGVAGINNPGATTLAYTYTAAGRVTQRAESGAAANGTPVTRQYDPTYGYETSETTPGATLSGLEYSSEGELLGATSNKVGSDSDQSWSWSYSVRGELTAWPVVSGAPAQTARYANGVLIPLQSGWSSQMGVDARMGVIISSSYSGTQSRQSVTGTAAMTFDIAGRLTKDVQDSQSCCDSNGDPTDRGTTTTRAFDAEDHTANTTTGTNSINTLWGPDGHPIAIGTGTGKYEILHWNGNSLLYTTNDAQHLDEIKIGAAGDILPLDSGYKGLTFYDRALDGSVMGCHNAAGATFAGLSSQYYSYAGKLGEVRRSPCVGANMPASILWWGSASWLPGTLVGQGGVIGMPRTDGITDGVDTIQGARTYDSDAGNWTTPDAFGGVLGDPATQKPYVYDGNNPIAYSDPSGFNYGPGGSGLAQHGCYGPTCGVPTDDGDGLDAILSATGNDWADQTLEELAAVVQVADAITAQGNLDKLFAQGDPMNGSYPSPQAAAEAASALFGGVTTTYGVEVGCVLYCTAGGCGYLAPIAGTSQYVNLSGELASSLVLINGTDEHTLGVGGPTVTSLGIWHTHPDGTSDVGYHALDMDSLKLYDVPYEIFTSIMGGVYGGSFLETAPTGATRCISGPCEGSLPL